MTYSVKSARPILILLALLVVVLAIVFVAMARKGEQIIQLDRQELERTQAVAHLRTAYEAMLDMESAQRGYLLTGDESYLQPLRESNKSFSSALEFVRAFAHQNEKLANVLQVVANFQTAKNRELTYAVSLFEAGQTKESIQIVLSAEDRHVMEAARQQFQIGIELLHAEGESIHAQAGELMLEAKYLFATMSALILGLVGLGALFAHQALVKLESLNRKFQADSIHDLLTGLPNRRYLEDWFPRVHQSAVRNNTSVSLLFLDLDGFKRINDDYGHDVGDQVLKSVATQFKNGIRGSDFIARMGGDEFVILVHEDLDAARLRVLTKRLLEIARSQHVASVPAGALGVSIGVAHSPQDGDSLAELLKAADDLMYKAKQAGKGQVIFSHSIAA